MKILDYIKEKLNPTLCPKHKVPFYIHGYYNMKGCEKCDDENDERIFEELKLKRIK